jgi:hypothetical protein
VDLVTEAPALFRSVPDAGSALTWKSESRIEAASTDGWSIVSVHLLATGRPVGRVDLWRCKTEEPLHSELAALVDVIAEEFPRLIDVSPKIRDFSHSA